MTVSSVQPLDFSGLHTYAVHDRHSKVSIDDFAAPVRPGMSLRELLAGLPRQLAGADFPTWSSAWPQPDGPSGRYSSVWART